MCGRFSLGVDTDRLVAEFGIDTVATPHHPRFNIAPGQAVPAIVRGEGLRLGALRWGLVPHWARDPAIGSKLINARSETVDRKPAFRDAFRDRRCWVPADGFYEWYDRGGGRRPVHFSLPEGRPFALAGLWDRWGRSDDEIVSCTLLTVPASDDVRPFHDRMPVILAAGDRDRWLDPEAESRHLRPLLRPYPNTLRSRLVSPRVNDPSVDDPACVEPLEDGHPE